jgi:hypothetical protein
MSGVYTITSDILLQGDRGARGNACLWRCMIAAIAVSSKLKFDEALVSEYLEKFATIVVKGLKFPEIGEDVDLSKVLPILDVIANHYDLHLTVLQCDSMFGLVFHDLGVRIGKEVNKTRFFLCLYGRHFYLHKINNLAPINQKQMIAIQNADLRGDLTTIDKLQSDIWQSYQATLAKRK